MWGSHGEGEFARDEEHHGGVQACKQGQTNHRKSQSAIYFDVLPTSKIKREIAGSMAQNGVSLRRIGWFDGGGFDGP